VAINGLTHRGDITGHDLANAICAAYNEKPDECDLSWKLRSYQHGVQYVPRSDLPHEADEMLGKAFHFMNKTEQAELHFGLEKARWAHIIFGFLLVVAFNLCIIRLVRRAMKREINHRVNMEV
jgi:hypothetical protein